MKYLALNMTASNYSWLAMESPEENKNSTHSVEFAVRPVESVCQPIQSQNADIMNARQ